LHITHKDEEYKVIGDNEDLSRMKTVYKEGKEIPIAHSSDVVVLGGGPSGVSAAISATGGGVKVTLIERFGYLGGQATEGLVILSCGLTDGKKQVIEGFCQEVIKELQAMNAANDLPEGVVFEPEARN
jgi:NADPH-dependent 2,4-dienoyl-CoA reductase/sulfur reductase-like enzyme